MISTTYWLLLALVLSSIHQSFGKRERQLSDDQLAELIGQAKGDNDRIVRLLLSLKPLQIVKIPQNLQECPDDLFKRMSSLPGRHELTVLLTNIVPIKQIRCELEAKKLICKVAANCAENVRIEVQLEDVHGEDVKMLQGLFETVTMEIENSGYTLTVEEFLPDGQPPVPSVFIHKLRKDEYAVTVVYPCKDTVLKEENGCAKVSKVSKVSSTLRMAPEPPPMSPPMPPPVRPMPPVLSKL